MGKLGPGTLKGGPRTLIFSGIQDTGPCKNYNLQKKSRIFITWELEHTLIMQNTSRIIFFQIFAVRKWTWGSTWRYLSFILNFWGALARKRNTRQVSLLIRLVILSNFYFVKLLSQKLIMTYKSFIYDYLYYLSAAYIIDLFRLLFFEEKDDGWQAELIFNWTNFNNKHIGAVNKN